MPVNALRVNMPPAALLQLLGPKRLVVLTTAASILLCICFNTAVADETPVALRLGWSRQ
jgi:hypothetical protein